MSEEKLTSRGMLYLEWTRKGKEMSRKAFGQNDYSAVFKRCLHFKIQIALLSFCYLYVLCLGDVNKNKTFSVSNSVLRSN